GSSRKHPSTYQPRLPIPMAPRTIRSLGATPPSLPSTDPGTICGRARRAPVLSAVLKKLRRLNDLSAGDVVWVEVRNDLEDRLFFILVLLILGSGGITAAIMTDRDRWCRWGF